MCSIGRHCRFAAVGFPIRTSSDQRLYTASRGFSQCPTSFIGTWRQGIHRKPLVASPRDAEKLILFVLTFFLLYRPTSIAIQFLRCTHRLTGERRSRYYPGHRSPFNLFTLQRQFDPATPPGRNRTQLGVFLNLYLLAVKQFLLLSVFLLTQTLSGDGGI